MRSLILGGAGFIGTNLALEICKEKNNIVTLVDSNMMYFDEDLKSKTNICFIESSLNQTTNFDSILDNQDIVYHLVSTTVPTTSNKSISEELVSNIEFTIALLESCVRKDVKKVIFISSGGTVYGKEVECPLKEDTATNPITSYGVQKITIEKILYLYNYLYNLDYRVIRLANPYGPYQRPNGVLGAATTFTYRAMKQEEIIVYGDGTVIRDYIFIDDAIKAINKIVNSNSVHKVYNLGSGHGISLNQLIDCIKKVVEPDLHIQYKPGRKVDVPVNYLDISRYEEDFGKLNPISLEKGIEHTFNYLKNKYS